MKYSILFILPFMFYMCSTEDIKKVVVEDSYSKEIYFQDNDSLKQGVYIQLTNSGDTIELAHYKDDKLHGKRYTYSKEGKLDSEENYNMDVFDGPEISYYPNGNVHTKGNFTNGVLDSLFYSYYETGELKEEVTLHENVENGPFTEYYKNGAVHWKGTFINGDNEVGLLIEYDENGDIVKKMDCGKYKGTYICQTIWNKEQGEMDLKFEYEK